MPLFNVNILNPPLPEEELNPIFLAAVNSDNHYQYYRYPSLDKTTIDLGLTDRIFGIDTDQITNEVYSIDELGVIRKWDQDGSNVQILIATGYTDATGISIDAANRFIVISGHYITAATGYTVRFYDMDTLSLVHSYFSNVSPWAGLRFNRIHADPVTEKVYSNQTQAGLGTGHVWSMAYATGSIVRYGPVYSGISDIITFDGYSYQIDGGILYKQDLTVTGGSFADFVYTWDGTIEFLDVFRDPDDNVFIVGGAELTNRIKLLNLDTLTETVVTSASNTYGGMAVFGRPLS